MSSNRIKSSLSCFSERTKTVIKYSMMGASIGAVSGATIGGIAVGFTSLGYYVNASDNFKTVHGDEYPPKHCWTAGYHVHCGRPELNNAASAYASNVSSEKIAETGPWIAIGCTAAGAVLGLFAGARKGWKKDLTLSIPQSDIENAGQLSVAYQRFA